MTLFLATIGSVASWSTAWAEATVALAGPMSGRLKALGDQMRIGAEMAVADINKGGGVNGEKLKLAVFDDACEADTAASEAARIVEAKAALVAGHLCSKSAIAAAAIYAKSGTIMISSGASHPQLTEMAAKKGWRHVFRVAGRDDGQAPVVATYLAGRFAGKPIAILHDRSQYGRMLADDVRAALTKRGRQVALFSGYDPGADDQAAVVENLKASGAAVVFLAGHRPEGAKIISGSHELDFKPQFVVGDGFVNDEFWKIAGPAGEGTLMTFPLDLRKSPAARGLVLRAARAKKQIEFYGLFTYAAIQVWAAAARKAGTGDGPAVAAALREGRYRTVLGTTSFDEKGDVKERRFAWYVWQGGRYVER